MRKQIETVRSRIEELMTAYPQTRDDDKILWLAYCCKHLDLKKNVDGYPQFKNWILKNKIPPFESITRARRKIQELNPKLRGKNYKQRQEEEKNVRDWSKSPQISQTTGST